MTAMNVQKPIAEELQGAVAKVAITAILPILQMCADTLRPDTGNGKAKAIGYMTGLAFHQREEAQLSTMEVVAGLGQAYGERMVADGEVANAAAAIEVFAQGVMRGLGKANDSEIGGAE